MLALVVGVVGGIYGIAGGSLLAPILIALGFSVYEVAPATIAATFVTSIVGIATYQALQFSHGGAIAPEFLKQLRIDYLKIDVEFVRDLASNAASRHVVQAVVALARAFSLQTVGEGVEDAETLTLLRELGVDYAQGYHIARPGPLDF